MNHIEILYLFAGFLLGMASLILAVNVETWWQRKQRNKVAQAFDRRNDSHSREWSPPEC